MKQTSLQAVSPTLHHVFQCFGDLARHRTNQAACTGYPVPLIAKRGLLRPATDTAMSLSLPQQDPKTGQDGVASSKQLPKLRSCVMCRTRKVRCDKLSPCTNCRKGGIECVLPSLNRPPRWARRLEQNAATGAAAPDANANQVMGRLKSLEALVKDLNGKLEKANAAVAAATAGSSAGSFKQSPSSSNDKDEPSPGSTVSDVQNQMGRLVMGNGESRYISGDFWARINDEVSTVNLHDTNASIACY